VIFDHPYNAAPMRAGCCTPALYGVGVEAGPRAPSRRNCRTTARPPRTPSEHPPGRHYAPDSRRPVATDATKGVDTVTQLVVATDAEAAADARPLLPVMQAISLLDRPCECWTGPASGRTTSEMMGRFVSDWAGLAGSMVR